MSRVFSMALFLSIFVVSLQGQAWSFLSRPEKVLVKTADGSWRSIKYGAQEGEFLGIKPGGQSVVLSTDYFDLELFSVGELEYSDYHFKFDTGSVRIKIKKGSPIRRWAVQSALAVGFLRGKDFLIRYDHGSALYEAFALQGDIILRGEGRDEENLIKEGEVGAYKGVAELDGPAFDIMLKGKKVARGDLLAPKKVSAVEMEELMQSHLITAWIPPKPKKLMPKPGEICAAPFAKLDQCAWFCENNLKSSKTCRLDLPQVRCVRRRCNVNGEWKEEERVPAQLQATQCQALKPTVGACDY